MQNYRKEDFFTMKISIVHSSIAQVCDFIMPKHHYKHFSCQETYFSLQYIQTNSRHPFYVDRNSAILYRNWKWLEIASRFEKLYAVPLN